MIKYDQHVHTLFSTDSEEIPENHVKRGIELGLDGVCFTDHMDFDYPYEPKGQFEFNVSEYMPALTELKNRYEGRFFVGRGIEIGLRNEPEIRENMRERLNSLVKANNFDYVIGSMHLLDMLDVSYEEFWQDTDLKNGLTRYFEATKFCVDYYDCFDTLGHLDYIIRYAPYDKSLYRASDYFDIIDEVLKTLIYKGKALEVNTKGLKPSTGLNATNPGRDVLIRYKELGGELITAGSDAHFAEDLAGGFDKVSQMLTSCGFKYYTVFKNRVADMKKL